MTANDTPNRPADDEPEMNEGTAEITTDDHDEFAMNESDDAPEATDGEKDSEAPTEAAEEAPAVPPEPEHKLAAVIYNPVKVDVDVLKATVEREEQAAGWEETLWFETSVEDTGNGVTKKALEAGATMILAAGGDGTVRAVAEAMWDSDASLALLPSGTGNLLARNLNLTLDDLDTSVNAAFAGKNRNMDIALMDIRNEDGKVSKHAFLVMAGLGLDAKMLANTDEDLKKKVGWLAYVDAIFKALRDKNQLRLRYSVDGNPARSLRAHTIIVGNTGTLQANVLLLPEAVIDDGYFEIVLLRPEGFIGWLQIGVKVLWENGVLRRSKLGRLMLSKDVDAINYVKGRELIVKLRRPEQIELDGDDFGKASAFKARVVPGGLTVRVPADA
jgi:diacylglycerol kinase family enzyme